VGGVCVTGSVVVVGGVHDDIFQIIFESPPDGFSVLIDYQAYAMSHHQRGPVTEQAGRANVQNLIGIDEYIFTVG
jgi:hypothetical protein